MVLCDARHMIVDRLEEKADVVKVLILLALEHPVLRDPGFCTMPAERSLRVSGVALNN